MSKKISIAIDAMGGDNSPEKVIKGIEIHNIDSKNTINYYAFFVIYSIFK